MQYALSKRFVHTYSFTVCSFVVTFKLHVLLRMNIEIYIF